MDVNPSWKCKTGICLWEGREMEVRRMPVKLQAGAIKGRLLKLTELENNGKQTGFVDKVDKNFQFGTYCQICAFSSHSHSNKLQKVFTKSQFTIKTDKLSGTFSK